MNPVIARLQHFSRLTPEGRAAVEALARRTVRCIPAHQDLVRRGDSPRTAFILISGWAARYKTLEDGRQQVTAFLLPGDVFDLNMYLLDESDHSVAAVTEIEVAELSREDFEALTDDHPTLTKGLLWQQLVLAAMEREWVVNMARRSARERVAHLLCEIYLRLRAVGLADETGCELPLTQSELAEAAGMTPVHINRILQDLRREGILDFQKKRLEIHDLDAAREAALFDATYLHQEREDETPSSAAVTRPEAAA